MTDWYEQGKKSIFEKIASEHGCNYHEVVQFYRYFTEVGLAGDYDVEKEVFYEEAWTND